jgi:hypothetical protein
MGFFAVVRTNPTDDFSVVECHINLWCLAGLLKRRVFFFDVGLRLRAGVRDVSTIEMALPFGIYGKEANGFEDLQPLFRDDAVCQLVFGRQVDREGQKLRYQSSNSGPTEIQTVDLDIAQCKRLDEYSGHDFSYWSLKLSSNIKRNPDSYIRLRFRVRNAGRTWIWKRSGLAKNGALIDLRVTDIRETTVEESWMAFRDRIASIEMLNFFVIAPSWLQLRSSSPSHHYMRLFEGRIWEKYLRRAVDLRRNEKLVIYQWRNSRGTVSASNPFHAFLDLSQEFGLLRLGNHLRVAFFVTIFLTLLTLIVRSYPSYSNQIQQTINALYSSKFLTITGLTGLLGALVWVLFRYVDKFQKLTKNLRNRFLKFEERIFRLIMHS